RRAERRARRRTQGVLTAARCLPPLAILHSDPRRVTSGPLPRDAARFVVCWGTGRAVLDTVQHDEDQRGAHDDRQRARTSARASVGAGGRTAEVSLTSKADGSAWSSSTRR